jgi:nucleoside-diphosphate-sugar epimerase
VGDELVCVTGGSGFVATHCILKLLSAGHRVRTTVRTPGRERDVEQLLAGAGADPGDRLSFATADLVSDDGWSEAISGCTFVLHVASPFPAAVPKDENELIVPARDGALRVLRASRDAGVRRVVLTSSLAAIGYGRPITGTPVTEETWTDLDGSDVTSYVKSKTIAERAAWDFVAREGGALELAAVNPPGIFGPVLGADYSASIEVVRRLLDGAMPGSPDFTFPLVDVRDVADLHLLAMTSPQAKGERFLAVAGDSMHMVDMAKLLKARMGPAGRRVPTRQLPTWLVKLAGRFDPEVRQIVPELGRRRTASNEKARRVLGWSPRSNEEAVLATAESLVRLGLVKP